MRNFVRFYEFKFFDLDDNNVITEINNKVLSGEINFNFNYNVISGSFNTAKFYIINISTDTLNMFTSKKNRRGFYFRATYDNPNNLSQSLIFRGLTYRVNSYREGTDLITEITACDVFFNLQLATIKSSQLPKFSQSGILVSDIIQSISNYLGVFNSISGADFLTVNPIYFHPFTFSNAPITDILDNITRDNACTWGYDIAGIKIYPLPNNPSYGSGVISSIPLISKETGLVGNIRAENLSVNLFPVDYYSEQRLKNNHPWITANCYMRPIPLFSKVRINCENKELNGVYIAYSVSYQGEYRGKPWYTTMKLSPFQGK